MSGSNLNPLTSGVPVRGPYFNYDLSQAGGNAQNRLTELNPLNKETSKVFSSSFPVLDGYIRMIFGDNSLQSSSIVGDTLKSLKQACDIAIPAVQNHRGKFEQHEALSKLLLPLLGCRMLVGYLSALNELKEGDDIVYANTTRSQVIKSWLTDREALRLELEKELLAMNGIEENLLKAGLVVDAKLS